MIETRRDWAQVFISFLVFYFLNSKIVLSFTPRMIILCAITFGFYAIFDWMVHILNLESFKD